MKNDIEKITKEELENNIEYLKLVLNGLSKADESLIRKWLKISLHITFKDGYIYGLEQQVKNLQK